MRPVVPLLAGKNICTYLEPVFDLVREQRLGELEHGEESGGKVNDVDLLMPHWNCFLRHTNKTLIRTQP